MSNNLKTREVSGPVQVFRNLFEPHLVSGIKTFFDDVLRYVPLEDDAHLNGTPLYFNRSAGHNIPFFVEIHKQLTELASTFFGEKVKPSYSYLSRYNANGVCPLHIDRDQCRYTIDYLIQQEQPEPWPIRIGNTISDAERDALEIRHVSNSDEYNTILNQYSWTEVLLNPNDAVAYSGTHSWHYRPEPSAGKVDLVFFHFVPVKFDGPLD